MDKGVTDALNRKQTDIKLVTVGSAGVGKTCILTRLQGNEFPKNTEPTIEEITSLKFTVDAKSYTLGLIDTAGLDDFATSRDQYYKLGDGFVVVCALNKKESLKAAEEMLEQIKRVKDDIEDIPTILVGNKCDLDDTIWEFTEEEGTKLAKKFNCEFIASSALENVNIQKIFETVVRWCVRSKSQVPISPRKKKPRGGDSSDDDENVIPTRERKHRHHHHKERDDQQSLKYKIAVLGAGGVGKSCVSIRFTSGTFVEGYDPTIYATYSANVVDSTGRVVVLEILDSAGSEEFQQMREMYYRQAQGFLLIFNVTSPDTTLTLGDYKDRIEMAKDNAPHVIFLVANKCDIPDRLVSTQAGNALATKLEIQHYFEVSAKTGDGIKQTFMAMVEELVRVLPPPPPAHRRCFLV